MNPSLSEVGQNRLNRHMGTKSISGSQALARRIQADIFLTSRYSIYLYPSTYRKIRSSPILSVNLPELRPPREDRVDAGFLECRGSWDPRAPSRAQGDSRCARGGTRRPSPPSRANGGLDDKNNLKESSLGQIFTNGFLRYPL